MNGKTIFHTLDAIRGILALMVITRHGHGLFDQVNFTSSYMAVDVFFLLSGVVICQAYEQKLETGKLSWQRFTLLRVIRIYPLYLLGCALGLLYLLLNPEPMSAPGWIALLVATLLMIPNPMRPSDPFLLNPASWSLFFEMAANIFYAVFAKFLTTPRVAIIALLSAIGLAGYIMLRSAHNADFGYWLSSIPFGFFRVSAPFFIGILLYRYFSSRDFTPRVGGLANIVSIVIVALVAALMTIDAGKWRPLYDLVCILVIFPALIWTSLLFQPAGKLVPICRFLGITSYAVYTLHVASIKFFADGSTLISTGPLADPGVRGAIFVILFLPLCYWIDKIYDAPVRRWLLDCFDFDRRKAIGANLAVKDALSEDAGSDNLGAKPND